MSSDWKESGIKKRDFQHSKSDPEIPKPRKSKKVKKTHMLIIKDFSWWDGKKEDYVFSKYTSLESAEQALHQKQNDYFWGRYIMEIREIK
jgi:hypothetical protein